MVFGLIFVAIIIWIIYWLVTNQKFDLSARETPLEIAKKRFAKGEITKKQFEELKKELKG